MVLDILLDEPIEKISPVTNEFEKDAQRLRELIENMRNNMMYELDVEQKSAYRRLHQDAVCERLLKDSIWIAKSFKKYSHYFANGEDIHPDKIRPRLVEVTSGWKSDIFRLARYTWSLPYSSGYGRRMRFLIMDDHNDKLIGIIGLQSPPIDFKVRDDFLSIPKKHKVLLVNQMMDIFTLGAIPPYNILLGGKLVALASASNEIRTLYAQKYDQKITHIQKQIIPSHLIALTTTSAFGRSSIYNRLKFEDRLVAQSLGFTKGYGSFHVLGIYDEIKAFLKKYDTVKSGYGDGPRSVWVNSRRASQLVGVKNNLLEHGVQREIFLFPLLTNLNSYVQDPSIAPLYYDASFEELSSWWKNRWLLERANRVTEWQNWKKERIEQSIIVEGLAYERKPIQ